MIQPVRQPRVVSSRLMAHRDEVQVTPRTTEAPSIKGLLTLQLWSSNSCSQGAVVCAPEFPSHWSWETRGNALRVHLSHQQILGSIFQKTCPNTFFFENHCFLQGKAMKSPCTPGVMDWAKEPMRSSTTSPARSARTNNMLWQRRGMGTESAPRLPPVQHAR